MKLHSINQENKTAIIDMPGTLIEVEYYDQRGTVWLTNESCAMVVNEGLNISRVRELIWRQITGMTSQVSYNHLASAPKAKAHINLGNEMQEEMENALRGYGVNDNIENPSHYQILPGVEVINVRRALIDKIPSGTDLNAVDEWSRAWEYLTRMWGKNGLEDAKKARVYLNWLIERMEKSD